MGHPDGPDDYAMERWFHIPGQDLVWRWVLPGSTAIEGPQSTQAKCSASAMVHTNRRRNSNECFGAYGHEFTFDEMNWLSNWCFVRGVNMLIPHAFYYSVRGPRLDERPPDVGPNSGWWETYRSFSDSCRRLSWLNTDSIPYCSVAILCDPDNLPWHAAKICFENQIDFHYLDTSDLVERAIVTSIGIELAGLTYTALIMDGDVRLDKAQSDVLGSLAEAGRLFPWEPMTEWWIHQIAGVYWSDEELVKAVKSVAPQRFESDSPASDLRVRCVEKDGNIYWLLFNEGLGQIVGNLTLSDGSGYELLSAATGLVSQELLSPITFAPGEIKIVRSELPPISQGSAPKVLCFSTR